MMILRAHPSLALACCVCRYFDGTPSFHDFGSFTGLAKEARYVKEIPAGTGGIPYARFTTMSYDEMVASRGGRLRRLPQRGILEIMSRSAEYAWCCVDPNRPEEQTHAPEGHGSQYLDVHRHHIYPPVVLKDTSCATLANLLSQDGDLLTEISKKPCPWKGCTVIHDLGDGAKPNIRWKKSQHAQHKDQPDIFYDEHSRCAAHCIHNAITSETGEDRLVGHVHAVMTVLSVHQRRDHIIKVFKELVAEEIEIIAGQPPENYRKHSEKVLTQTLLRRVDLIRSRLGISYADGAVRKETCTALRDACKRLLFMLNGDITRAPIQHYECGCCGVDGAPATKEVIVENVAAACIEAGIFGHRTSDTPAKNRWLTCAECLALIAAGMMFHRILPRVWARAFPKWEIPQGLGDADDFHKVMKAKVWRAKVWLSHPDSIMRALSVSVTSAPADHLLMVLQRLDEEGGSLFKMVHPTLSPAVDCLKQLGRNVLSPVDGPHSSLLHHFHAQGSDTGVICQQVLTRFVLGLASRVWLLYKIWTGWPYRLVRLVAADASDFEKESIAAEFFALSACCLDRAFSLKVRRLAGSAAGLLKHAGILAALRLWGKIARITNMHTERLINLHQRSSPPKCVVARVLAAGFLSHILSIHKKAGGLHPSSVTRAELREAGVPIRARGLSSADKRQRAQRVREAIAAHTAAIVKGQPTIGMKKHFNNWVNHMNRVGPRVTRPLYRQRQQDLKARWNSDELLSDVDDDTEACHAQADRAYLKKIGHTLWECSDRHWPVLPSRLSSVAETIAPPARRSQVLGLTARLHQPRQDFLKGLFVGPEDSPVPLKRKLTAEAVCKLVAIDVCMTVFPASLKRAQAELEGHLLAKPIGTFVEVRGEYCDGVRGSDTMFLVKSLQTKDRLVFVECRRDHIGAPFFPPFLPLGFAFLTVGKLLLHMSQHGRPTSLHVIFYDMKADAAIDESWKFFPLPPQIEEVGRVDVQLLADHAAFPLHFAPPGPRSIDLTSGTNELDDLEADDKMLPEEQAALQMETSLVGGLQKLKARRKQAKTKARSRVTMARNARKRKLMGPQRGAPPAASSAGPSAAAPVVPPPPPAPAVPIIRALRTRENILLLRSYRTDHISVCLSMQTGVWT